MFHTLEKLYYQQIHPVGIVFIDGVYRKVIDTIKASITYHGFIFCSYHKKRDFYCTPNAAFNFLAANACASLA